MTFDNKHILVIGGGSGIGEAVAERAVGEGASVVIASSNADKLARAADRLGPQASSAVINVIDEEAVSRFFANHATFDHIVFTAGDWSGQRPAPLSELNLGEAAKVFGVRFWGALIVAKHAEKVLPAGGSLTLTGGMLAHRPTKNSFVVTAMAGGIEHVTQGLAVELAPIRVNCVCLGVIRTGIYDSMPEEQRDELIARWTARQPIPRAGKPEEAAEAYLYSMRAGYTTGQVLYVEGGLLLSN